jgi:hypothetical protein
MFLPRFLAGSQVFKVKANNFEKVIWATFISKANVIASMQIFWGVLSALNWSILLAVSLRPRHGV